MLAKNDREYGYYNVNSGIVSDVDLDMILNKTSPDKIYFGSDWHLLKAKNNYIKENPDAKRIIRNYKNKIKDDDVFIYLGDLVDDEVDESHIDEICDFLKDLKGYKIFILGNNDLFNKNIYTDQFGFDKVFEKYQYGKFILTHRPTKNFGSASYNIHGHMHEYYDYYNEYDTQANKYIKIYTKEFKYKPISLKEIVDLWNKGYFIDKINKIEKVEGL